MRAMRVLLPSSVTLMALVTPQNLEVPPDPARTHGASLCRASGSRFTRSLPQQAQPEGDDLALCWFLLLHAPPRGS